VGLVLALALLILGPSVWVAVLHHAHQVFPYQYPTLISMPAAFLVAVAASLLAPQPRAATPAPHSEHPRPQTAG
jgi:SSS family solute:Na+ symporter/cation/acetate symporter